jgi:hypothetical protein
VRPPGQCDRRADRRAASRPPATARHAGLSGNAARPNGNDFWRSGNAGWRSGNPAKSRRKWRLNLAIRPYVQVSLLIDLRRLPAQKETPGLAPPRALTGGVRCVPGAADVGPTVLMRSTIDATP